MKYLQKILAVTAGLSLAIALGVCVKTWEELRSTRQELRTATSANDFLRKTLGDMSAAITAKDKEVDRLQHGSCGPETQQPRVPAARARDLTRGGLRATN
jgi:hypothetical protein